MQEFKPELFLDAKWDIIAHIARKPSSPTEIAEATKTSISNVVQQLKILEAYDIVKGKKIVDNSPGKPRTIYTLASGFAFIVFARDGRAQRKYLKMDPSHEFLCNAIIGTGPDDAPLLSKMYATQEEFMKKCKAIGFLKSNKENIELFIITDHLDDVRSKHSNLFIGDMYNKTKKIVNWSHNEQEITDGLNRKDKYFMDMIKNAEILYDPNNILTKFKRIRMSLE